MTCFSRPQFYSSGGDLIQTRIGRVPDDAVLEVYNDTERRIKIAADAGEIERTSNLCAGRDSFMRACVEVWAHRRASGGVRGRV